MCLPPMAPICPEIMESWQKQQIRLDFPESCVNLAAKSKPEILRLGGESFRIVQNRSSIVQIVQHRSSIVQNYSVLFKYRSSIVQVSFRIVQYRSESFSIVQVSFRIVQYQSAVLGKKNSFFGTFSPDCSQNPKIVPKSCSQNILGIACPIWVLSVFVVLLL